MDADEALQQGFVLLLQQLPLPAFDAPQRGQPLQVVHARGQRDLRSAFQARQLGGAERGPGLQRGGSRIVVDDGLGTLLDTLGETLCLLARLQHQHAQLRLQPLRLRLARYVAAEQAPPPALLPPQARRIAGLQGQGDPRQCSHQSFAPRAGLQRCRLGQYLQQGAAVHGQRGHIDTRRKHGFGQGAHAGHGSGGGRGPSSATVSGGNDSP
ncbi:hypothetical protein D3C73_1136420 [compost metagenome]